MPSMYSRRCVFLCFVVLFGAFLLAGESVSAENSTGLGSLESGPAGLGPNLGKLLEEDGPVEPPAEVEKRLRRALEAVNGKAALALAAEEKARELAARAAADVTPPPRAWIGVQVGAVPAALAKHLRIGKNDGALVINVVKDGPAARAEIEQYDVVVAVGEENVSAENPLPKLIAALEPETTVKLGILRAAERLSVEITLDASPMAWEHEFVYPPEEDATADAFSTRGWVFRPDAEGQLVPEDVFRHAENFVPMPPGARLELRSVRKIERSETKDGHEEKLSIEELPDGRITVEREKPGEDGKMVTEKQVYADREALKTGDPTAHEFLESSPRNRLQLHGDQIIELDVGAPILQPRDLQGFLKGRLVDPKSLEEFQRQFRFERFSLDPLVVESTSPGAEGKKTPAEPGSADHREFSVGRDGVVKVRILKPTGRVELEFESLEELREKHPALHQHYLDLVD
jgi:hypothetical protein